MSKSVDTHELSEPWAQRVWHIDFKIFTGHQPRISRLQARKRMLKIRREAALERIIARLQRRVEYLEADLKLAQQQTAESEEQREFAARLELGA